MDQSDIENSSGSETDETAEVCVEVAPPKKQKNEEWRTIISKTDIYNKFRVHFVNDRKTIFRKYIECGTVVKSVYCMGLIFYEGFCGAQEIIRNINSRLSLFDLSLTDIDILIADMVSDGQRVAALENKIILPCLAPRGPKRLRLE